MCSPSLQSDILRTRTAASFGKPWGGNYLHVRPRRLAFGSLASARIVGIQACPQMHCVSLTNIIMTFTLVLWRLPMLSGDLCVCTTIHVTAASEPPWYAGLSGVMLLYLWGSCIAYLVIIGDSFHSMISIGTGAVPLSSSPRALINVRARTSAQHSRSFAMARACCLLSTHEQTELNAF